MKYAFQQIHRGQRIFDIYSPDMVTAQQEFIYLLQHSPQETELLRAAEQRLILQGLTAAQINQVKVTKKAFYTLPVYSPYEGYVLDVPRNQNGTSNSVGMGNYASNGPLSVTEGMFVNKGQTIFNVVNPHQLWAVIKVQNTDVAGIKLHQPVSITLPDVPDKTIDGKVDFIEPVLQSGDKTTSIRVYLHDMDHDLKVNSLVKAVINTGSRSGLWIPRSAMLSLGQNKMVWLKQGRLFKVHQVETGYTNGDSVLVIKGVTAQDSLVRDAQYLTDSESFIQIKTHGNE